MRLLVLLFFVFTTYLSAATEHLVTGLIGPENAYRGYSAWFKLEHGWFTTTVVTSIDTATNVVTAPNHGRAHNDTVRLITTGTFPSVIGQYRRYATCNVTTNTFVLRADGCSGTVADFTDTGSGILKIAYYINAGGPSVFLKNVTGPSGVSVGEVNCVTSLCPSPSAGKYRSNLGVSDFFVRMDVSPSAAAATGTVSATVEVSGSPDRVFTLPFTPRILQPLTVNHPTAFPAIPGKANWQSTMLQLANYWCIDKAAGVMRTPLLQGNETQVWYYDGAWVYHQIADYTGDTGWRNCAKTIAEFYRGDVLDGGILPFRVFSDGMKRQCSTCDGRYKSAIRQLATPNTVLAFSAGSTRDDFMRETAYLLEACVSAHRAYGQSYDNIPSTGLWPATKARMERAANQLLGQLDMTRGGTHIYQQTFFMGLALKALISYYDFTQDPRIPVAVKAALDYIWSDLWSPPGNPNTMAWHKAPYGPKCDFSCYPYGETALINLTVPAFAWLWWLTGDDTYRTRGDTIFSHSLDTPIDFSGKVFSQNYRWSIDYVRWREGLGRNLP